jgi:hypothetical protein
MILFNVLEIRGAVKMTVTEYVKIRPNAMRKIQTIS